MPTCYVGYLANCVVQSLLPEGGTLIPILLASDESYFTNFSRDKKLWPVYMSIRNVQRTIRNTTTMHTWIPIALLPISPKRVNKILGYSVETQEIQALQTVHDVLAYLLRPLSNTSCRQGQEMVCADGNVWLCFPKLFRWLVDYMENVTIHDNMSNWCPICTVPMDKFRNYTENGYAVCLCQNYAAAYARSDGLNAKGVKNMKNALWSLPNLYPPDLFRTDILHNILLGILDHIMQWIQGNFYNILSVARLIECYQAS